MRVSRLGAAGAMLAATTLVACGGARGPAASATTSPTAATTTTTAGAGASSSTTTRHRAPLARVRGPRVGARQGVHAGGADITVTILRVLALTDTGSPALPGTRQVGVLLRIADQSGQTYDSTSSGDVSLILSHGQSEPLDVRRGVCQTQLVDFESHVYPGDVRTGCVGFSVPRSARVRGVRFSPYSRPPGTLTWRTG